MFFFYKKLLEAAKSRSHKIVVRALSQWCLSVNQSFTHLRRMWMEDHFGWTHVVMTSHDISRLKSAENLENCTLLRILHPFLQITKIINPGGTWRILTVFQKFYKANACKVVIRVNLIIKVTCIILTCTVYWSEMKVNIHFYIILIIQPEIETSLKFLI